jgi:hypothetical protein
VIHRRLAPIVLVVFMPPYLATWIE